MPVSTTDPDKIICIYFTIGIVSRAVVVASAGYHGKQWSWGGGDWEMGG